MIGSALKRLASENNMMIDGGVAYGALKGCFVSLSEGKGYKRLCIYVGCHHASDEPTKEGEIPEHLQAANAVADTIIEEASDFKTYRIMNSQHSLPGVAITQGGSAVQVNFFDNPGTMKCIHAFIENILPQVAPYTEPQVCAKCGLDNNDASKPVLLTGEVVVPMHAGCAEQIVAAAEKRKQKNKAGAGKTFLGVIGAFVGSLIGAIVWALIGIAGYVASIAGFVAAFLAGKGYDLMGGKPGKAKLITIILCVILAVVVGTVLPELYWLHDLYQAEIEGVPASQIILTEGEFFAEVLPMLVEDPEVAGAFAKDILMGLFFAALGCWTELRSASGSNANKVRILKG